MIHANEFLGARPQTAILVTPALQALAKNGYSHAVLRHVESGALRAAAQTLQHRQAAKLTTTRADLAGMVERNLTAGEPVSGKIAGDAYLAHLMSVREIRQRAAGVDLVQTAGAIQAITSDDFGDEPAANASYWLAKNLHAMQEVVQDMRAEFPEFAGALQERSMSILAASTDRESLLRTLEAMSDVADELHNPDDEDGDRHGA